MPVEQVLHPQADAGRLVGVRRPDAAEGGAQLVLAEVPLGHAIELLVVRHDQVSVPAHPQPSAIHAPALEHVDLVDERPRLDDHPVSDHRRDVVVEHAAGDQLQRERLAVDDDRVPGVVTALVANDHCHLFGDQVGELAFALVTPLGSDDDSGGHVSTC